MSSYTAISVVVRHVILDKTYSCVVSQRPAWLIKEACTATLRGHNQRFLVPFARTQLYQYSFFPDAIRLWNSLPPTTVACNSIDTFKSSENNSKKIDKPYESAVDRLYKKLMGKVPQSVVVVTTAEYDILKNRWMNKGLTCTSFTNVSYHPPIVSFCVNHPSKMHDLLLRTQHFAIHVLGKDQVAYSLEFAKHVNDDIDQFARVPHTQGHEGIPIIAGCSAVMQCRVHSVHTVGDHHVWYGSVFDAVVSDNAPDTLLYYFKSFRSVGDEIFIKAFEDATLPYEDWTHEAHLRMAWTYITEYGKEKATPFIREGIQHFNEQNKDKVKFGYHETITGFYISIVADSVNRTSALTFDEFITKNSFLFDKNVISKYYTKDRLYSDDARHSFVTPDICPLPC
ncbi:Hypothetical predicted protein [Mytilus galloprovincialis]|uniref:Flavin reductase like domain-containing protein n=1 Tax=Mytilus galloprovincialis TaxID=29158 RepID=A0A8B6H5A7_MYTGA|nr:Hypothetical predicted protein [Mytilus galloprovincialis]